MYTKLNNFPEGITSFSDEMFKGVDFSRANLSNYVFKKCVFDNCKFTNTNLSKADLSGSTFKSSDTELIGFSRTNLSETDISNTIWKGTSFIDTSFKNSKATKVVLFSNCKLQGVDFSGHKGSKSTSVTSSMTFADTSVLQSCDFTDAQMFMKMNDVQARSLKFNRAKLRLHTSLTQMKDTDFSNVQGVSSNIRTSTLTNVSFKDSTFDKLQFKDSQLTDLDLSGMQESTIAIVDSSAPGVKLANQRGTSVTLHGSMASDADCSNSNFRFFELTNTQAHRLNFSDSSCTAKTATESSFSAIAAQLDNSNFSDCKIHGGNIVNSILPGTSFKRASIERMLFTSTNANDTDFSNTILRGWKSGENTFNNTTFENSELLNYQSTQDNFNDANFTNAKIDQYCRFSKADLSSIKFPGASLENATFSEISGYPTRIHDYSNEFLESVMSKGCKNSA